MTELGAEKLSVEMCAKKARECRAIADGDSVRLPHRMVLENIADLWESLGAALTPLRPILPLPVSHDLRERAIALGALKCALVVIGLGGCDLGKPHLSPTMGTLWGIEL